MCWGYGRIDGHMYYWWDSQWLQSWRALDTVKTFQHRSVLPMTGIPPLPTAPPTPPPPPLYMCTKRYRCKNVLSVLFLIANSWRHSICFPRAHWSHEILQNCRKNEVKLQVLWWEDLPYTLLKWKEIMAFKYMPVYVFYVFVFNVEQSGKQIPIVLFKKNIKVLF